MSLEHLLLSWYHSQRGRDQDMLVLICAIFADYLVAEVGRPVQDILHVSASRSRTILEWTSWAHGTHPSTLETYSQITWSRKSGVQSFRSGWRYRIARTTCIHPKSQHICIYPISQHHLHTPHKSTSLPEAKSTPLPEAKVDFPPRLELRFITVRCGWGS